MTSATPTMSASKAKIRVRDNMRLTVAFPLVVLKLDRDKETPAQCHLHIADDPRGC